jgi:thiamine pyrophosphokinase
MNAGFWDYIDITKYRSLVCLNGALPGDDVFVKCAGLPIIAVDGAANKLTDRNIKYDAIVGDLDSARSELLTSPKKVIHLSSQDSSDFEKTIAHLKTLCLLPSIILGISGGHLDHVLHNINIFTHLDCVLYAPPIFGMMIKTNASQTLHLPLMTKISFVAMPSAIISTRGLKWELEEHVQSFPGTNSCFNRSIADEIIITVTSGQVLVLIHTEDVTDCAYV